MKSKLFIVVPILLILFTSCRAQKLVQTPSDAYKLVEQKNRFIGKPLKVLLDEIRPEIKSFRASKWIAPGGALVFMFMPYDSVMRWYNNNKMALQIRVTVREAFEWDLRARKENVRHVWQKEDEEKYKNLTIAYIEVAGELM